jgi:rhodanese-related sulfurtransferase
MKKKIIMGAMLFAMTFTVVGCGANSAEVSTDTQQEQTQEQEKEETFNYYTAEQLKTAIENNEKLIMVDIQVEDAWNEHHIKGAISTKAYPVKTDDEKAKIDAIMDKLDGDDPIVVICPGGKGGAQNTVNHLKSKGIAEERLFILENGQGGWPYEELLEK